MKKPCLIWNKSLGKDGTGRVWAHGEWASAVRYFWEKKYGRLYNTRLSRLCDNKLCVEPDHYKRLEETLEPHPSPPPYTNKPKLTESDVVEIRALLKAGHTQLSIAKKFGVAKSSIGAIATGENYKWVPS